MVNQKDILARLQAGESADVIAQELVDALNAANAEFAATQEKAKEQDAKREVITKVADAIKEYVLTFHGDSLIAEMVQEQELDMDEVIEMLDQAFAQLDKELRNLKHMESMFEGLLAKIENAPAGAPKTGKIEPNVDALGVFLKANGLA